MKLKLTSFLAYFTFALIILSAFAISDLPEFPKQKYYNFVLQVPDAEVFPGDNITLYGNVTNMGMWTLRQMNLTLQNMPYKYEINPNFLEEVRILRDWNPEVGVFRLPYNFSITIFAPQNAAGVHLVKLTGQELGSWRQVSNSTEFILKVISVPKISVSEISVPSKVNKSEPFAVSIDVKNEGVSPAIVNTTVTIPSDWKVPEKSKQTAVAGNSTEKVIFYVTPSNLAGTVTAKISYEFRNNVTTVTKSSSLITPLTPVSNETAAQTPAEKPKQDLLTSLITAVKGLSPIVIGILVLILLIVVWNVYKIIKVITKKGKKPEEMKKATASV